MIDKIDLDELIQCVKDTNKILLLLLIHNQAYDTNDQTAEILSLFKTYKLKYNERKEYFI